MSSAIVFNEKGAPDVLQIVWVEDRELANNEILIRQTHIGVNHLDLMIRSGKKALASGGLSANVLGYEASGIIEAIGSEVQGFKVGGRVAYATAPRGAYCQRRSVDQSYVISLPDSISEKVASAALFKGLTAHYLATRAFIIRPGTAVLIHAAAGGVGHLLAQFAKMKGAVVLGTVGSDAKKDFALQNGCHKVFNYQTEDWQEAVKEVTEGRGVNAVYDPLGRGIFEKSLECLMPLGIMISYGDVIGDIGSVEASAIRARSLFLTMPSIFHYKANRMELILSAQEVFSLIESEQLKVNIYKEYQFVEAAKAHSCLEARESLGSLVLTS